MLRRLSLVVAGATLVAASAILSAANATFVLKNGERVSGEFRYKHGGEVYLVTNGQERSFPFDQIAMIAFTDVNAPKAEVDQLATSDSAPELERHLLVLKDGRTVKGKLYDFTDDSRVVFDTRGGSGNVDRQSFNLTDVARLYMSATSARSLFGSGSNTATASNSSGGNAVSVRVSATTRWTDTAINVNAGDKVSFTSTGEVKLNANTTAGPGGNVQVGAREDVPLRTAPVGALVGRVGNRSFLIGDSKDPINMPASGRLVLTVNDDILKDNTGAFDVQIKK
jgi:hypothetical protein